MPARTFNSDLSQYRILCILAELADGPKSTNELADALGMDRSGVPAYLAHLRARVAGWRRSDGNYIPIYDMKRVQGVGRPPKHGKREQWQRIKADPVRHNRVKALQRIRQRRLRDGWAGDVAIVIDGTVNRR